MKTTTAAVGTTATEAEILAATEAALAAGEDPFGDNETTDAEAATTDETQSDDDGDAGESGDEERSAAAAHHGEDDAQQDNTDGDGEEALTAEQLAAVADNESDRADDGPLFRAQSPAEYQAARKELLDKRAKAFKDYSDGTIDPEEFSRIDIEVFDALEALTVQRTLYEANAQRESTTRESVLDAIITQAKGEGIDYTDNPLAAKRFDLEMDLLAQDGVKRSYAQAAALAHKNVLAVMGKTPKAAEGAKPTPAQPRANGKPPITLRNAPAAEVPNNGGGWQDQLNKLSGQAYEDAFNKLTPAQQAQLRGD